MHNRTALCGGLAIVASIGACQGVLSDGDAVLKERAPDVEPIQKGQEFECDADAVPTPPLIRRLTREEYLATVHSLTGVNLQEAAQAVFPSDPPSVEGFSNAASALNVQYEEALALMTLAQQAVDELADASGFIGRFAACRRFEQECTEPYVRELGLRAFGAPLVEEEFVALHDLFDEAVAREAEFDDAALDVLNAVLQSPRFVYRVEAELGSGVARPLDGYELARRLSFLLLGSPPDEPLLQAAARDELSTDSQLEQHVDRMLDNGRARVAARGYLRDWLDLDAVRELSRSEKAFDGWTPELAERMYAETTDFFDELVWNRSESLRRLYDADFTVVDPTLAEFYGIGAPDAEGLVDLAAYPERGGLFTHGGLLAISGGPDASSVKRGLFFSAVVMCGANIAEPPADVDTSQPPPEAGRSKRYFSEARVADGRCAGCHASFEPPVWGLIRYDAVGAYSPVDVAGNDIPEDGYINFVNGESVSYNSPRELGRQLAEASRVAECLMLNTATYALGRALSRADSCSLAEVRDRFLESDQTYRDLLLAVVLSPMFRTVSVEPAGVQR